MTVGDVLNKWAIRVVENMKRVLSDNRKVNTGRLYNSIQYDVDETNHSFTITMNDYGKFVDSGRRRNAQYPPRLPILEWLSTNHGRSLMSMINRGKKKKISIVSASYMVQKSISKGSKVTGNKGGIKPVRFLNQESKIKNVVNAMGSFKTDLQKAIGDELKNK